jgi:Oxidoreductase molybdopterin binding domain
MIARVFFVALLLAGVGGSAFAASCPGGPTTSFSVTGQVQNPTVFDMRVLQQLPTTQENVTYFSAGSVVTQSFTGALLWDLLNNSPVGGIVTNSAIKNDILHKIVIVTGSDCYQSVFGAGEIDPFFAGDQIMVAYAVGGQPLGSIGFARIVAAGDKAGGRFVSMIANIDVEDASSYPLTPPGKPQW